MPAADADLLPAVAAAARDAGALAMSYFRAGARTAAGVSWKEGGSPVTEADVKVDRMLRERLSALRGGVGWLSEEAEIHPSEGSEAPMWIVDPIDGTRAFMAGEATWGVSIALAHGGRPALAALVLPALDKLFLAATGRGATLNGAPLAPEAPARPLAAGPKPALDRFLAAVPGFAAHPKVPSLAARVALAAEGVLAVAIASGGAREWDLAAADLILAEAGGRLTDLEGRALRYDSSPRRLPVLIGSREADHDLMAAALGAALAKSPVP